MVQETVSSRDVDPTHSKASVQYTPTHTGNHSCGRCRSFVRPDGCQLVKGTIQRAGWCSLWQAKL
jgi:hypothetical protein